MTAAFNLIPTGDPAPCGYPGCILSDYHEGEHAFAEKPKLQQARRYRCVICQRAVVVYGEYVPGAADLCDSQQCLLDWATISAPTIPLSCPCSQRPYAHDLRIHGELRREAYNPKLRAIWPWSLMLSDHVEFSTEAVV